MARARRRRHRRDGADGGDGDGGGARSLGDGPVGKWIIRVLGLGTLVISIAVGYSTAGCGTAHHACPGYALGQSFILRGERALGLLTVILALLVVFWRLCVDGELPRRIGRDGLDWTEPAREATRGLAALDSQSTRQRQALQALTDATASALHDLSERVDRLEDPAAHPHRPPAGES